MKKILKKSIQFIKKNAYAVTVAVCMIALVLTVAVTAVIKNQSVKNNGNKVASIPTEVVSNSRADDPDDSLVPVNAQPVDEPLSNQNIIFYSPVEKYTLGMGYNRDTLIYNKTLKEWSTHLAIDYIAESGSEVMAAYSGEIESIDYSMLDGTIVVIKHNDNLKSVYKSLSNEISLNIGDHVERGQVIGKVSDSMMSEVKEGAHLHFEVLENNEYIDPNKYLNTGSK